MDARTVKFICFAIFSALSLAGGYLCRQKNWVREERSQSLHFHTVAWPWSLVSLLSIWRAPLTLTDTPLVGMQTIIVAAAGLLAIPLARWAGCNRSEIGVTSAASGVGNLGFTLGGYICYSLLPEPEKALGIAIAYVTIMQVAGILILYPVARVYSPRQEGDKPLWLLIVTNIFDLRAMPLYAAVAGQCLPALGMPYPRVLDAYYTIDILFYLGSFGGYFGIGLRLHLAGAHTHVRPHLIVAAMRFLFIPLLTLGMVAGLQAVGHPLSDLARNVVLLLSLMPSAIQSVMIANLFHLDARLASSLWLVNTILFFVLPLPVILLIWGR